MDEKDYRIAALAQALEELAISFMKQTKEPLGFFPAFVQAKQLLRVEGRELPAREE